MALKKQLAGGAALVAAVAIGFGLCAPPAQAAYTITIEQVGSDVVATGSGSINFDALAVYGDELDTSLIAASGGAIIVGPTTPTDDTYYSGVTGPITFGAGGEFLGRQRRRRHRRARHFRRTERRRCRRPAGLCFRSTPRDEHRDLYQCDDQRPGPRARRLCMDLGRWGDRGQLHARYFIRGRCSPGARTRHLGDDGPGPCGAGAFANAPPYSGFIEAETEAAT